MRKTLESDSEVKGEGELFVTTYRQAANLLEQLKQLALVKNDENAMILAQLQTKFEIKSTFGNKQTNKY